MLAHFRLELPLESYQVVALAVTVRLVLWQRVELVNRALAEGDSLLGFGFISIIFSNSALLSGRSSSSRGPR